MMEPEQVPQFPQYPAPTPTPKVDFAERSQSRILWKALKQLTKPRPKVKAPKIKKWKKPLPYY